MKNILKNKNVLITGATGGLGKEFCYQLADIGANLCITSKTESKLLSLQNKGNRSAGSPYIGGHCPPFNNIFSLVRGPLTK